ncbi:MAG: hypothetical protein ACN4GF_01405 [Lentimonas sp.]
MDKNKTNCTSVGCGGTGICPGVALLISIMLGYGIEALSGSTLFASLIGVPLCIALILGWPQKQLSRR